jgi:hypothetical protein
MSFAGKQMAGALVGSADRIHARSRPAAVEVGHRIVAAERNAAASMLMAEVDPGTPAGAGVTTTPVRSVADSAAATRGLNLTADMQFSRDKVKHVVELPARATRERSRRRRRLGRGRMDAKQVIERQGARAVCDERQRQARPTQMC